jgi:homoserine/homoserine lactone efflux protein
MPFFAAIPTFFAVSIMPGLCMTLAMTLGTKIGIRRTLWMMIGELTGVGLVATLSILGVAAVIVSSPFGYRIAKIAGAAYLIRVGIKLFMESGAAAATDDIAIATRARRSLLSQGFVAAVSNPKAWILYASLFPPFIDSSDATAPQIPAVLSVILAIEFACLLFYASCGQMLVVVLKRSDIIRLVNLASGMIIIGLACMLLFLD